MSRPWWDGRGGGPRVRRSAGEALVRDAAALARVSRKTVCGALLEVRPVDHPGGRVYAVWYYRGAVVSATRAEMVLNGSSPERVALARAIMG